MSDLGSEIKSDIASVTAFIQREGTVLEQDAEDAYNWLKNELAALAPTVLADLKAAVNAAVTEVIAGDSEGTIVANALTVLARDGADIVANVKSDVLTALVGLTAATP